MVVVVVVVVVVVLLLLLLLWADHRARVAQADAQVVGALRHIREDAQQALHDGIGKRSLLRRRHSRKDAALGAEDRRLAAPLGEAAGPGQRLEAHEDAVLQGTISIIYIYIYIFIMNINNVNT